MVRVGSDCFVAVGLFEVQRNPCIVGFVECYQWYCEVFGALCVYRICVR